ncbi:MAG: hypothetical protein ACM3X4_01610 [Ignavibacteriales bacterium]
MAASVVLTRELVEETMTMDFPRGILTNYGNQAGIRGMFALFPGSRVENKLRGLVCGYGRRAVGPRDIEKISRRIIGQTMTEKDVLLILDDRILKLPGFLDGVRDCWGTFISIFEYTRCLLEVLMNKEDAAHQDVASSVAE